MKWRGVSNRSRKPPRAEGSGLPHVTSPPGVKTLSPGTCIVLKRQWSQAEVGGASLQTLGNDFQARIVYPAEVSSKE